MTALTLEVNDTSFQVDFPGDMSREEFFEFCQANPLKRIERDAQGNILVMSPTGLDSSHWNLEIGSQLHQWTKANGTGVAFDSNAGFELPNGSVRSPDASWLSKARHSQISQAERRKFARVCPEFVIELRSPSDRLPTLTAKLEEYIANGARLGLLIDPEERKVHVYRPGKAATILDEPATVACDPEMPGLVFDLVAIWST